MKLDELKLSKYEKESEISYSFGIFPTFELVKKQSDKIIIIILSSKLIISKDVESLLKLCKEKNIEVKYDDKTINRLSNKENCFVIGVFKKYQTNLICDKNNLVLVNPSDMGNMGTIMRTMLGFGLKNLIIVKPAVDIFNPKVIRASMGAIFSLNILEYNSIEEYLFKSTNKKYSFMLKGKNVLGQFTFDKRNVDLIFGNEATGLPDDMLNRGESVIISHSRDIDSLNLPISVGIALYEFTKNK